MLSGVVLQLRKLSGEILGCREPLVDTGEPYIGDMVDLAQHLEHCLPDLLAGDHAAAGTPDEPLDTGDAGAQRLRVEAEVGQRAGHAHVELVTAEGLDGSVTLAHAERLVGGSFERGEALMTR